MAEHKYYAGTENPGNMSPDPQHKYPKLVFKKEKCYRELELFINDVLNYNEIIKDSIFKNKKFCLKTI